MLCQTSWYLAAELVDGEVELLQAPMSPSSGDISPPSSLTEKLSYCMLVDVEGKGRTWRG
jgi:hypothetical protein